MKEQSKSNFFLISSYLEKNGSNLELEFLRNRILEINKLNVSQDEKYRIINFKPKSLIELNLVKLLK